MLLPTEKGESPSCLRMALRMAYSTSGRRGLISKLCKAVPLSQKQSRHCEDAQTLFISRIEGSPPADLLTMQSGEELLAADQFQGEEGEWDQKCMESA